MPVLMRENTMIGNLAIKPGERESVSVTGDGEKTAQNLLYELAQKIDASKISNSSYMTLGMTYTPSPGISSSNSSIYYIQSITILNSASLSSFSIIATSNIIHDNSPTYEVESAEIVITPTAANRNHFMKTKIEWTDNTQTAPNMTFESEDSQVIPEGLELKFYY